MSALSRRVLSRLTECDPAPPRTPRRRVGSFLEFVTLSAHKMSWDQGEQDSEEKAIKEAFKIFDEDGNGRLDKEEFAQMLKLLDVL